MPYLSCENQRFGRSRSWALLFRAHTQLFCAYSFLFLALPFFIEIGSTSLVCTAISDDSNNIFMRSFVVCVCVFFFQISFRSIFLYVVVAFEHNSRNQNKITNKNHSLSISVFVCLFSHSHSIDLTDKRSCKLPTIFAISFSQRYSFIPDIHSVSISNKT